VSAPSTAVVADAAVPVDAGPDKRPLVEALLTDIFRLMDYPVTLDFKDLSDGSLGVAVHVTGEQPGITPGKKSFLVDSVQFLVNKAVNRPNVPRRWINLGINGFPEPRPERPQPAAQAPAAPKASAPAAPVVASAPRPPKGEPRKDEKKGALERARDEAKERKPQSGREADEASMSVTPDAAWTAVAKALAEKSARLGRPYGVMLMTAEDRARLIQAAAGVKGVTVKAEGEGHWRRVAFKPEKLTPMPKKSVMPDYGDDEDE
jgi:predicted RNA-binding protein Jag